MFLIVILIFLISAAANASKTASQQLLELGSFAQAKGAIPARWRVVSYTIHHPNRKRLEKIIRAFEQDRRLRRAHLIALQEADPGREEGSQHDARDIARALRMHYLFAAHFPPRPGRRRDHGVAILSAYPLSEPERIKLPPANLGRRARVAVGARVNLCPERIRVYRLHIRREVSVQPRREQIETVIWRANSDRKQARILILGDLNTVSGA